MSAGEREATDSSKLSCRERETQTIILNTRYDIEFMIPPDCDMKWAPSVAVSKCSVFWNGLQERVVSHYNLKTSTKIPNKHFHTSKVAGSKGDQESYESIQVSAYCSFVLRPSSFVLESWVMYALERLVGIC